MPADDDSAAVMDRLTAPHNIAPDADGNAAFHNGSSQVQYPVGEQTVRATETSAAPTTVTTVPGT
jgi:hypothetical protein